MGITEPDHLAIEHWTHNGDYPDFTDKRPGKPPRWMNLVKIPPLKNIPQEFDKTISVVVTNWRYTQWLDYALGTIIYQDFPSNMLEIIVVDDNSGGNIYEEMEKIRNAIRENTYTRDVNLSFYETHKNVTHNIALAFNIGCKRAKNDIIINSPADCFHRGEFLRIVSRYHTYFAKCNTRTALSPNILCKHPKSGVPEFKYNPRPATDVGLSARLEDYHNIKGYDERFRGWGGNEPDITGRMGISGVGIGFCPNVVIATSLGELMKVIFHDGIPTLKPRHDTPDGGEWKPGANNHILSRNNYDKQIYCPNSEWGELDTLEKVF